MSDSHLDNFAAQILNWTELETARGQLPFRRLETGLELETAVGRRRAPLIFWINRDSLLAGGLLFFPRNGETLDREEAGAIATAIGLNGYASWEPQRIHLYSVDPAVYGRTIWTLPPGGELASFRAGLGSLLQELKLTAVTNAIPPTGLPAPALANLCLLAQRELQLLLEQLAPGNISPQGKSELSLVRLLYAQSRQLLPPGVYPEKLEQALRLALHQLPERFEPLALPAGEAPLPEKAAVRFHHLWHRLQQIDLVSDDERLGELFRLLLGALAQPGLEQPENGHQLCSVNLPGWTSTELEIAPPARLALAALYRDNLQRPEPRRTSDIWQPRPLGIGANLYYQADDQAPLSAPERDKRRTLLRSSWPQRRFKLPGASPGWLWDLIHLLGQLPTPGRCLASLPPDLLQIPGSQQLWDLLKENFRLAELTYHRGRLRFDLRLPERDGKTLLSSADESRDLPWSQLRQWPLSWLLLALHGETALTSEAGQSWQRCRESLWNDSEGLVENYFRHGEGARFCTRLNISPDPRLTSTRLKRLCCDLELPLPELSSLTAGTGDGELTPPTAAKAKPVPVSEAATTATAERPRGGKKLSLRLVTELADELFAAGVPDFPAQYLYRFDTTELRDCDLPGELELGDRFFDRIGLRHQGREHFNLPPAEAGCLLLAAATGQLQLQLPPRADCADLLRRYLTDLRRLQLSVEQAARAHSANPAQQRKLTARLWQSRPLPSAELLDQARELLE